MPTNEPKAVKPDFTPRTKFIATLTSNIAIGLLGVVATVGVAVLLNKAADSAVNAIES